MGITDKTRKTLWARSGNRCAMCRAELVAERNEHDKNLNIGDECHIISGRPTGPRHNPDYKDDFDDYANLILLCKNHHREADELWETYTEGILKTIKSNHEKWVRSALDDANLKAKSEKPTFLKRINTGKEIVDIINSVEAYQFDHDEFRSKEEADFVAVFLQNLQDWGEASSFGDYEIGRQIELGFSLNDELRQLENLGFFLFGERRRSRMTNASKDDLGTWNIAVLLAIHKDNPAIIEMDKLATEFKL